MINDDIIKCTNAFILHRLLSYQNLYLMVELKILVTCHFVYLILVNFTSKCFINFIIVIFSLYYFHLVLVLLFCLSLEKFDCFRVLHLASIRNLKSIREIIKKKLRKIIFSYLVLPWKI